MEYFIHLAILVGIYAILGLSLNLIVGYTGLLSVTHAAFYGIGAYATAI
ncbi:MAG: branched-chain amino acid ABC transporter permease, partial [bacterium]|nr:branched-chain amino acid ABC transporter permease [bacterium]